MTLVLKREQDEFSYATFRQGKPHSRPAKKQARVRRYARPSR